ncbi:MAG: HesB/IscA family protein [Candidatus Thorarchaeota archaeon]
MSQQQTENPINFTENALTRIKEIISKKKNPDILFRLNVIPSGCSGLQYDFQLDTSKAENDIIFQFGTVNVVISSDIVKDIKGSTIDFQESLLSSQFVVNNPLATKTCNCGISFQTATNKGHIKRCS